MISVLEQERSELAIANDELTSNTAASAVLLPKADDSSMLHGRSRITARDLGLGWTLGDAEPNTFHKNRVCKTICKTLYYNFEENMKSKHVRCPSLRETDTIYKAENGDFYKQFQVPTTRF